MDISFLRALLDLCVEDLPYCLFKSGKQLHVCSGLLNTYHDLDEIPEDVFVTGWQEYSGEKGSWHSWNQVRILDLEEKFDHEEYEKLVFELQENELNWTSDFSQTSFCQTVRKMKSEMHEGKYFLANLTRKVSVKVNIDPFYVAALSCLIHSTPFRFFHHGLSNSFLGLSPERFLKINSGRILSEPMKGTSENKKDLLNNDKEYVENTMMIDLVRSDLAKVCIPETIRLEFRDQLTIHPGLTQNSSVLSGKLLPDIKIPTAIKEILPVASVTGTPKPFVVKRLNSLENERGLYCGVYGFVDTRKNESELAVSIRTLEFEQNSISFGVGAGITIESDENKEWQETELKASRLKKLIQISSVNKAEGVFTSLRIGKHRTTFALINHCERITENIRTLGVTIDGDEIYQTASNAIASCDADKEYVLKIYWDSINELQTDLDTLPLSKPEITLGLSIVPGLNMDGYPKYRNRNIYNNALMLSNQLARTQIDDCIAIVNGFVSETSRANLIFVKDNQISIPSLKVQQIRGVAQKIVIEELSKYFRVIETKISIQDLSNFDYALTTNSVRGVQRVSKVSSILLDRDIEYKNLDLDIHKIAKEAYFKACQQV